MPIRQTGKDRPCAPARDRHRRGCASSAAGRSAAYVDRTPTPQNRRGRWRI
jgi:hypothetical protein